MRVQPIDLFEMEAAWRWRRNREWEMQLVASRFGNSDAELSDVLTTMPGYEPE